MANNNLRRLNMSASENPTYFYVRLTASGLVKTGGGVLGWIIPSASSSGTVALYDNTAGSGTLILNTCPLVAGTPIPIPARFQNGCYAVLGGTADVTFLYT